MEILISILNGENEGNKVKRTMVLERWACDFLTSTNSEIVHWAQ